MAKTENGLEKPPFVSSWRWLYVAVLLNLAFQIFLFTLFTKAFQ